MTLEHGTVIKNDSQKSDLQGAVVDMTLEYGNVIKEPW
eukprot:gene3885-15192_t